MRRTVTQKDVCGCGWACAAFVISQSYETVGRQVDRDQAVVKGFTLKEIRQLLAVYGVDATQGYVKSKRHKIYQQNTIVFIKPSAICPTGHYLIRYKDYWMDPWINLPEDRRIQRAKSGYRKRLPGQPIYAIFVKAI